MGKRKIKKKQKKITKFQYKSKSSFLATHKSLIIIWSMVAVVIAGLIGAYFYILQNYTVTTVYVNGNVHYTNEEIMNMVMEGYYGNNSLFLTLKYKDKSIKGVPFVEKMDVEILAPDTIRIEVYEKALAGYVEYLERYMYFDKDGIVVECAETTTAGIPQVAGLNFDHVVLYEALPVEDPEIFQEILSITQLVTKYNITTDKIFFGTGNQVTLYFGDVKVALGENNNLDEKIMKLQYMLPELEGKSGTLRMENYTENMKNITFEPD